MYTRKQYLNNKCTFEEYYSQLVSESTKKTVLNYFSKEELEKMYKKDNHFNSVSLDIWDNIGAIANRRENLSSKFKELDDYCTLAGLVCVVKTAARQIINKNLEV